MYLLEDLHVKHVLIRYHLDQGSMADWHRDIEMFIACLESDPELREKITYRAMRTPDNDYYHMATAVDQDAADLLAERAYFEYYTGRTSQVSAGQVSVIPLEVVAETRVVA